MAGPSSSIGSGAAESFLAAGDLDKALAAAMEEVRSAPNVLAPRLALFQLASVAGDWSRAARQLDAMAALDPEAAMMSKVYQGLIDAEAERTKVLSGSAGPVCLGEPPEWLAQLSLALALDAKGVGEAAAAARESALEQAEPSAGEIDGSPFSWIMDADPRFGPVLEVIVNGSYRWLPFTHLKELRSDAPSDLKDLVWLPVHLSFRQGYEVHAFVPVRYPASEKEPDMAVKLARATSWSAVGEEVQFGLGQRLLATDNEDHPLLDIRRVVLT